jgi:hypothetical protein
MQDRVKRTNVFSRHPDGEEILTKVLNKQMKQTEAARLLGCSGANVSNYLKKRNLRPTLDQKRSTRGPSTSDQLLDGLESLGEMNLRIDTDTSMNMLGAVGWRAILQGMLKMTQDNLEPEQYVRLGNTLIRMFEFQFRNRVPEIPASTVKIDRETEDRLIQRLDEFCEQCPYHRNFHERKARKQDKFRLEPRQSSPMG